jgi:Circularly permutated YpsA SLOG family
MNRQARPASSSPFHGVQRIVSGGQTGVDRAALDVAILLGIPHGGWCPKGRLCETGRIDPKYQLSELPSTDYAVRTLQNVKDSDGTLILYFDQLRGGTALTNRYAKEQRKPVCRVRINATVDFTRIVNWLHEHRVRILNIAGPRGSSHPDLESTAREVLVKLFQMPAGLFTES